MVYSHDRSEDFDHDLELIFDHLVESYQAFGEPASTAIDRAEARLDDIQNKMADIAKAPFQGTLRPDLKEGVRNVTHKQAIYYFSVDERANHVHFLAVFFGGQDHQRLMLTRTNRGLL